MDLVSLHHMGKVVNLYLLKSALPPWRLLVAQADAEK